MGDVKEFYNDIAECYHLIYSNWDQSILNQSKALSQIIEQNWRIPNGHILDCTCGIGTQSLGLASLGYKLVGSDISDRAIMRAKREANSRKLDIPFMVSDVRKLPRILHDKFDVVISCDNSLTHLPNKTEFSKALKMMYKCIMNGGGILISVRDYEKEIQTGTSLIPYGVREIKDFKVSIFQMREFYNKRQYRINLYFVYDNGVKCKTKIFRSEYFAMSIDTIIELMVKSGFKYVKRIDQGFFQPIIIGTKEE